MKIQTITLKNFRAFYGTHRLTTEGKNVLIYGENGSGKSSLYRALADFCEASSQAKAIEANIFEGTDAHITLQLVDNSEHIYQLSNIVSLDKSIFEDLQKYNPFFTYKRLLRTYVSETDQTKPNLFSLLVETVLSHHTNRDSQKTFGEEWKDIKEGATLDKRNKTFKSTKNDIIPKFNKGLNAFLVDLKKETNELLEKYFERHKVAIDFSNVNVSISGSRIEGNVINLSATIFERAIKLPYYDFLNEARLSALAICMYFASLKIIPAPNKLKILVLDDIFIGLDMSNRLPLLELLKTEFADYQIFMTTYDRAWFEVAKNYLGDSKWKIVEMFVGKNEVGNFEYPLLLTNTLDYYEKARIYANRNPDSQYKDKYLDYASAGNYLRKEVERFLKDYLYGKYRFLQKKEEYIYRTQLGDLWDSFKQQFKFMNFDLKEFSDFEVLSKSVFNPLSHDNLDKPIYKSELIKAFEFVDKLRLLKKYHLLKKGNAIKFDAIDDTNTRTYFLKAENDIWVYEYNGKTYNNFLESEFSSEEYEENGHKTTFSKQEKKIAKLYDMALFDMSKKVIKTASQGITLTDEIVNMEGKTIQQMIDELK